MLSAYADAQQWEDEIYLALQDQIGVEGDMPIEPDDIPSRRRGEPRCWSWSWHGGWHEGGARWAGGHIASAMAGCSSG